MPFQHFDEAHAAAEQSVKEWLRTMRGITKALLIRDLVGKYRLVIWSPEKLDVTGINNTLTEKCGPWWTEEILHFEEEDDVTRELFNNAIAESRKEADESRLFVLDRHRNRTAWFVEEKSPLWEGQGYPPIIVFYSFKGGLGRSTALASFAIQRARAGERVCVLDCDLDSPGVGSLLAADKTGLIASWGVVDFLLERTQEAQPLSDYYHRCDRVAGTGEIVVFPSGQVDALYPDKLGRVDLEEPPPASKGGLGVLLQRIRDELAPKWILLDARTGISASAGRLLSGIANLHVLLGTTQDQSWDGLNRVIDRLGKDRLLADRPQAEVVLLQAMVPSGEAGKLARDTFLARAEQEFTDRYYAEAETVEGLDDGSWDTSDMESLDAPHRAIGLDYDPKLASFGDIADVADTLCAGSYSLVAERITSRFSEERDS